MKMNRAFRFFPHILDAVTKSNLVFVSGRRDNRLTIGKVRYFARKRTTVGELKSKDKSTGLQTSSVPPPSPQRAEDAWVEVKDKASGQVYWWNTVTDETTELGVPKPTGAVASAIPEGQSGSMMGGLGRVVAEGFAFGVGSSVAHSVVGSIFGGGSHDNGGGADGGSDGDSWDI